MIYLLGSEKFENSYEYLRKLLNDKEVETVNKVFKLHEKSMNKFYER